MSMLTPPVMISKARVTFQQVTGQKVAWDYLNYANLYTMLLLIFKNFQIYTNFGPIS